MNLVSRVVARYLSAKARGEFYLGYSEAMPQLLKGNPEPMQELAEKALKVILPQGDWAPWFSGLSTVRRNQVKSLAAMLRHFEKVAPQLRGAERGNPLLEGMYDNIAAVQNGFGILDLLAGHSDKRGPLTVGGFVVQEMPGLTREQVKGALEALAQAEAKLRSTFPQVIYGDVYLSSSIQRGVAARYVASQDKFYVNVKAKKRFSDVHTICHELGHRFDAKFLKDENIRRRMEELSKSNPVTPYGATSATENFADAFSLYVLGMNLAPEYEKLFDQLK